MHYCRICGNQLANGKGGKCWGCCTFKETEPQHWRSWHWKVAYQLKTACEKDGLYINEEWTKKGLELRQRSPNLWDLLNFIFNQLSNF